MERYSRSPSPYRTQHRRRHRSSRPTRSPTPYRWRSPRERLKRGRSFQRQDSYELSDSRRATSQQRGHSRYPDRHPEYAAYRPYSIGRYARRERRDGRDHSPLYYVQFENGSTRIFKEVTRFPGPNLDPRMIYDSS
ncbi:uncharacterized protein CC84DRAFT_1169580 [Paraphaeosphaeria sporulosa]|uniref:Uncharacterized protein n=1 Tax=Paraphaeosphaeria sporulosa TaxID=1460663 RepID=A0A177BWG7_9PLEO|nr:uncharacterized protein CC84DRAFT_1169580 [Paraphaeosphaeria sporulosa]OAF99475.1 hypothetical protein CC84DRAFT_1169580 [Paraphaeosphaeria sporulosa]